MIIQSNVIGGKFAFVIDFSFISDYFKQFDHSDVVLKTSCEELSKKVAQEIADAIPRIIPCFRVHVFIQETGKSWAGFSVECERLSNGFPISLQAEQAQSIIGQLHAEASLGGSDEIQEKEVQV